jgi:aminoglycoside phosphotransferase (APT) family kinase protein
VFGDDENGAPDLIVKEGNMDKLSRERDSINRWHQLSPGLAPRVYGYREGARMAALLMEYLQGRTMQAVMMAGPDRLAERAYGRFASTIPRLWRMTKTSVPRPVDYVAQLEARLEDVRRLHPQFFSQEKRVGALSVSSLDQLLRRISLSEETMEAPFSVLIHGDFNANNVIYDDEQDRIHFIDLYRSAEGDYIQDASVFLVSCFRIPVLDDEIRSRLNWVAKAFLELVRDFAAEQGDRTVERRLALGLIRSFLTSTRFIPDEVFAEQLFSRAVYLMEALLRSRSGVGFRVPDQIVLWKGRLAA